MKSVSALHLGRNRVVRDISAKVSESQPSTSRNDRKSFLKHPTQLLASIHMLKCLDKLCRTLKSRWHLAEKMHCDNIDHSFSPSMMPSSDLYGLMINICCAAANPVKPQFTPHRLRIWLPLLSSIETIFQLHCLSSYPHYIWQASHFGCLIMS